MNIAVWTGGYTYWGRVALDNLWKIDGNQMGGSEAAALATSMHLAMRGHSVVFGGQIDMPESYRFGRGSVRIVPLDLFPQVVYGGAFDALVCWDNTRPLHLNLEHIPAKILCFQLNDATVGITSYAIDWYFHPSQWHATRFSDLYQEIDPNRQLIQYTNGVDPVAFAQSYPRSDRVVWASSPDRGLHHLLAMWPQILAQAPTAELHIFYDMDKWLRTVDGALKSGMTLITTDRALLVRNLLQSLQETEEGANSVKFHGSQSRMRLAQALLQAKVVAYPCDPVAPTEGFSMTTLEAWVAGCRVIVSDADALGELWGDKTGITVLPLPVQEDIWISEIVKALTDEEGISQGPRSIPQSYTWEFRAEQWEGVINDILEGETDGS